MSCSTTLRSIEVPCQEYQGTVKVQNRGVVQAETSRSASFEGWSIVFEAGNHHLHNLRRETARLSVGYPNACARSRLSFVLERFQTALAKRSTPGIG